MAALVGEIHAYYALKQPIKRKYNGQEHNAYDPKGPSSIIDSSADPVPLDEASPKFLVQLKLSDFHVSDKVVKKEHLNNVEGIKDETCKQEEVGATSFHTTG